MEKHKIVIAGGSGMIGRRMTELLLGRGYEVWWLSRSGSSHPGVQTAMWDPLIGKIEARSMENAYAVLNLAGEGIADGRWTHDRKQNIIHSRTDSTRLLAQTMEAQPVSPKVFIAASASGFYGNRGDEILTEDSPPGLSSFHSQSVVEIEEVISDLILYDIRTIIPRFGAVLSNDGGALPRLVAPLKYGIAGYMGHGRQWMPWIHIDDVCHFLITAIEDSAFQGIYNVTSPHPVTNKSFITTLRKTYQPYSILVPVPAFALRMVFGEMADTILDSAKVVPERLSRSSFEFRFPEIRKALENLQLQGRI